MKRVFTAQNLAEARLLADALGRAGIATKIFNEFAQGAMGDIPFLQALPELWVVEEGDEARAGQLIAELCRETQPGPDHPCPGCGEMNPASFGRCWSCGAVLAER